MGRAARCCARALVVSAKANETSAHALANKNVEILRIVGAADMRERLGKQGADVRTTTPDEFGSFIRTETAKWAKVVKDANVKVD